ncbi:MAG: hypothetical protein AABZ08_01410 [Planctomycetota bacterium]
MKKRAIQILVFGVGVVTTVIVLGQTNDAVKNSTAKPDLTIGRFQMVTNTTFNRHQYLLDTSTGRIWGLTFYNSGKTDEYCAWARMIKFDTLSDADLEKEIKANFGTAAWEDLVKRTSSDHQSRTAAPPNEMGLETPTP